MENNVAVAQIEKNAWKIHELDQIQSKSQEQSLFTKASGLETEAGS